MKASAGASPARGRTGADAPGFLRRLLGSRSGAIGVALVGGLGAFAIFGPLIAAHAPNESDFSLTRDLLGPPGPSLGHWLGTDTLFRDVLARLAGGARVSLGVAVAATAIATGLGAAVGLVSGMHAGTRLGLVDVALMRLVDVLLALPFLLFVTAVGVAVGRADVGTLLLVLGLTGWTGTARVVRARTLQVRELDYVLAARALGAGTMRVLLRHLLPGIAGTLLVLATLSVGHMILAEAILGYLTVGVQPPTATWGRMLHEAEPYLVTQPALVAAPGFAILLSVLGFFRLGEGLRAAVEPRGEPSSDRRSLPYDLVLAAAALLLVLVGAPGGVRPPIGRDPLHDRPVRGGVLRVATTVEVHALDPALAYDESAAAIQELLFARLVTFDSTGKVSPDLARAVDLSPDGRTYTFRLHEGLVFHDGTALHAADVKRSIERTLHPRTPSPAATHYSMIVGFSAFRDGEARELEGVRLVGADAVEIELTEADARFLPLMTMAFMAPVCAASGAEVTARAPPQPCGAGPFRLESWEPTSGVRLVRHEGYHRKGLPHLDGVEWLTDVRPSAQRYKFEAGDIDYVRDLTGADSALFRAAPAWAGRGRWTGRRTTNAVFLNTEMPPFDRREVRRAVAFALDPSVLEKVRPDIVTLDRVLPASVPGPDRTIPMRRHDLGAALAEMAKAGFPFDPTTGSGGYPEVIDYVTVPDSFEQQAAEVFQQQLARIGIRIRLRLVSFSTYLAEVSRRRTVRMGWAGWGADYPDPSSVFDPTLSSRTIRDEGSQNIAFFASAELDRVLDRARRETLHEDRMDGYAEAERIVRDEAPWVPTHSSRLFELWQPYVRGYAPHPVIGQRFAEAWLDPPPRAAVVGAARSPLVLGSPGLPGMGRR